LHATVRRSHGLIPLVNPSLIWGKGKKE
jgi:hypothetical protein